MTSLKYRKEAMFLRPSQFKPETIKPAPNLHHGNMGMSGMPSHPECFCASVVHTGTKVFHTAIPPKA